MNIVDHYLQQHHWRHWSLVFESLPALQGAAVLDLGCGVGDQATQLAGRGAYVTGIDMNEQVLEFVRSRQVPNARLLQCDLRSLPSDLSAADGIWSSFSAAYFPSSQSVLEEWATHLRVGGWLALTEIDDPFAQRPLSKRTQQYFSSYAAEALATNRYDFEMGRKLTEHTARAGLRVVKSFILPDDEFSCEGPVGPEVVSAWQRRLDGMALFRDF